MKHKFFLILFMVSGFSSCYARDYSREASEIAARLSMEQKIGQMILCALPGKNVTPVTEKILKNIQPGGFIFFGFNLSSHEQTTRFIRDLQDASIKNGGLPLFVSVDQEGGRVVRVTDGVTQFPGAMAAGVAGREDYAHDWGRILGMELRSVGFNMNFAPVLDVNNNPDNPVINTRSFGPDPALVARLGTAYIKGLQKSGCMAVCKHFPGHGDTNSDSHVTLPVVPFGPDRLDKVEWIPFRAAISEDVSAVMTAHIAFPFLLGNNDPATISPFFLTEVLRNRMLYRGLVITDDMEMKGVSGGREPGEAAVRAVMAGADIILSSSWDHTENMYRALCEAVRGGVIPAERINASAMRILEAKLKYNIISVTETGVSVGKIEITQDDRVLLSHSSEVNRNLSECGLAYSGDNSLLDNPDDMHVLVSENPVIRSAYKTDSGHMMFSDLSHALNAVYPEKKRRVLFYHVHRVDGAVVQQFVGLCRKANFIPVIVCTGNPFPLYGMDGPDGILASFSATDGSLIALGKCLSGSITPRSMKNFFPAADKKP